jgi:hypothetical protein
MRYLVRTYPALIPLISPSYQVPSRFLFLLYGIAEVSRTYSYSLHIRQIDHTYSRIPGKSALVGVSINRHELIYGNTNKAGY